MLVTPPLWLLISFHPMELPPTKASSFFHSVPVLCVVVEWQALRAPPWMSGTLRVPRPRPYIMYCTSGNDDGNFRAVLCRHGCNLSLWIPGTLSISESEFYWPFAYCALGAVFVAVSASIVVFLVLG